MDAKNNVTSIGINYKIKLMIFIGNNQKLLTVFYDFLSLYESHIVSSLGVLPLVQLQTLIFVNKQTSFFKSQYLQS